jgi:hypothetical protein
MQKIFPAEYSFIPRSFVLPAQQREFEEARKQPQRFIIKPDTGSVGYHITVLKHGDPLPARVANGYVGQKYLESMPVRFGEQSRKFDFRVYVLVTELDPLTIYMSRDGLARVCAAEYGIDSRTAQLTNTAINKGVDGVEYTDITFTFWPWLKQLEELLKRKKRDDPAVREEFRDQTFLERIQDIIVRTVIAALPEMRRGRKELIAKSHKSLSCFQIFGFDILIGKGLIPYVLEVNYRPSLKSGMDKEEEIKRRMLQEAAYLAVCQNKGIPASKPTRFQRICPRRKYDKEIERSCDRNAPFDGLLSQLVEAPLPRLIN